MGLDMYLYAHRRFDRSSDTGAALLAAAGTTFEAVEEVSKGDPMQDETAIYLGAWPHIAERERGAALAVIEAGEMLDFMTDDSPSGYLGVKDGALSLQVASVYWRKANAVHAWFVDECQDGIDECQESPVQGEQLAKLRALCLDALAAYARCDFEQARKIMEPQSGFFFGSTDVDEYWAADMQHTADEIERVIKLAAQTRGVVDFTYQASW